MAALQRIGFFLPDSLERTGAVVLRLVEPEHVRIMKDAHDTARMLHEDLVDCVKDCTLLFDERGGLGLAGFNFPTQAKQVFRMRRGQAQPYPSCSHRHHQETLNGFRDKQEQARNLLEKLTDDCLRALAPVVNMDVAPYLTKNDSDALSLSPYDAFYYLNDGANIVNCHEHVDPGLLTTVPCSAVPGLELLLDGQWLQVEHPRSCVCSDDANEPALEPFVDLVVFAGAYLHRMSNRTIPAVIHRVGKNVTPRLSLVYERRPPSHLYDTH